MPVRQFLPTALAAIYLGVSPECMRSWRRRGIGPVYFRLPGGHIGRARRYWGEKANGRILYRIEDLKDFIEARAVQAGRLPRPFAGRLPESRAARSEKQRATLEIPKSQGGRT